MQYPADERAKACIMNMVEVCGCKVDVMTLPTKKVNESNNRENNNTSGGRPNVDGIAEKEVFDG